MKRLGKKLIKIYDKKIDEGLGDGFLSKLFYKPKWQKLRPGIIELIENYEKLLEEDKLSQKQKETKK